MSEIEVPEKKPNLEVKSGKRPLGFWTFMDRNAVMIFVCVLYAIGVHGGQC